MAPAVLGWDIGGVNTKVARLEPGTAGPVIRSACLPFELKHDTAGLTPILTQATQSVGGAPTDLHAVTMTAELSQALRTKREGVGFVLDALGDAHLWLGHLSPEDYTCRTPDGRPPTREFAGERLARTVCADRDMLDDSAVDAIAGALAAAQVRALAEALGRIRERWPVITSAVVAGLGDFIAVEAAETVGLDVVHLADRLGQSARTAPAAAVAWLLWHSMESGG